VTIQLSRRQLMASAGGMLLGSFALPSNVRKILDSSPPARAGSARLANAGCSSGCVPRVSIETHESAGVPPHVESISPTGTFSFAAISRPKKYATAENFRAVSGVHVVHVSGSSFSG